MTLYYQKTHWHQIWLSLVQCSWLSVINKFSSETSQEFVWKCFKAKKSKTNPQLFGTVCQISFRSAIENFFAQKTCSIRPIHPQISGWVFKGTRTKYFNHSAISSTVKIAKIATYEISWWFQKGSGLDHQRKIAAFSVQWLFSTLILSLSEMDWVSVYRSFSKSTLIEWVLKDLF